MSTKDDNVQPVNTEAPEKNYGWAQDPLDVKDPPAPTKSDLDIEIVDDTPPGDRGRPPRDPKAKPYDVTDDEITKYSENAQQRIKRLRYEYHEERRQKEAAVRERDEAIRVAQQWHQANQQTSNHAERQRAELIEQARARSESEVGLAQKALAAAIESGKSDEIALAQTALTRAVSQQERIPPKPASQPAPQQQAPQQNWQPAQQQAPAQQQPQSSAADPKAVEWLKRNAWFGSDEPMTGYAYGLHEKLVKKGVHPATDEYYQEIDAGMRRVFPEEFDDGGAAQAQPVATQRPTPVAPPARGTPPRKVQLTATQAALAKRLGLTLEQYAAQIIKEQKANG